MKKMILLGSLISVFILVGAGCTEADTSNTNSGSDDVMMDGGAMMNKGDDVMMDGGAMMNKGDDSMDVENDKKMTEMNEDMMMSTGSYIAYDPAKLAMADSGKVVLFFRASWCPSCKAVDADIRANIAEIPAGVTILDVDYDKYKDLEKTYGVTYQHTFVQVDSSGNQLAKWSGSPTLSDIIEHLK